MADQEVTGKTILSDLYQFIKSAVYVIGVLVIIIVVAALFNFKAPEWTGNIVDDLLYFAYDYEKFGLLALFWRGFIVVAVFRAFIDIATACYQYIKSKTKKD